MVILKLLHNAAIARLISRIATVTSSFTLDRSTPPIASSAPMVMTTVALNRPEAWDR